MADANTITGATNEELLRTPWRETVDWYRQNKTAELLLDDLEKYCPIRDYVQGTCCFFPHANILLMGPVGAGKSSFLNTVASAFKGKIFHLARSGSAEKSLTTKLGVYQIKSSKTRRDVNFRLYDSMGLETDKLMAPDTMRFILEGNIRPNFAYDPSGTIATDDPGFNKNPRLDEKIHCVALCVDASCVDSMVESTPEVIQNIKDMQVVMNRLDVPQVVILTKVENACERTNDNLSNVYRSGKIKKCVAKVSEILGLPRNLVFPVKNYEDEGHLNTLVNILMMYTLKKILDQADAFLTLRSDEIMRDYTSDTVTVPACDDEVPGRQNTTDESEILGFFKRKFRNLEASIRS